MYPNRHQCIHWNRIPRHHPYHQRSDKQAKHKTITTKVGQQSRFEFVLLIYCFAFYICLNNEDYDTDEETNKLLDSKQVGSNDTQQKAHTKNKLKVRLKDNFSVHSFCCQN
jgi:hypothetical protein